MPSSTKSQAALMAAISHGWKKPGGGGPSVKVAKEFNRADAGTGILKRASGGVVNLNPSAAQKEAGNYKKHHVNFHGLDISIENPKGSMRHGTNPNGKPWSVKLPDHYGYIKRTQGADGDHVDVYLGPDKNSEKVFVIDQVKHDTKGFDEHKAMLGYNTEDAALSAYRKAFSDGKADARIGHVTELGLHAFKAWLKGDGGKKPIGAHVSKFAYGGLVNRAFGGPSIANTMKAPFFIKNEARQALHAGPIKSVVGGRTDHLPMNVAAGSHVIPADVVSGMGQGNTANGHAQLNHMFSGGPYGSSTPKMGHPRLPSAPKIKFKKGGNTPESDNGPVPIMAAGGEHVLTPAQVKMASLMVGGNGDPEHGHAVIDAWIRHRRKKTIKEMKRLPPPAKN